jgi:hypothetical protein
MKSVYLVSLGNDEPVEAVFSTETKANAYCNLYPNRITVEYCLDPEPIFGYQGNKRFYEVIISKRGRTVAQHVEPPDPTEAGRISNWWLWSKKNNFLPAKKVIVLAEDEADASKIVKGMKLWEKFT